MLLNEIGEKKVRRKDFSDIQDLESLWTSWVTYLYLDD